MEMEWEELISANGNTWLAFLGYLRRSGCRSLQVLRRQPGFLFGRLWPRLHRAATSAHDWHTDAWSFFRKCHVGLCDAAASDLASLLLSSRTVRTTCCKLEKRCFDVKVSFTFPLSKLCCCLYFSSLLKIALLLVKVLAPVDGGNPAGQVGPLQVENKSFD